MGKIIWCEELEAASLAMLSPVARISILGVTTARSLPSPLQTLKPPLLILLPAVVRTMP
ncbi:hypothetical protein [Nostoc sp. 'Peltigera membranacea cyanobiont' N6]|uniref:hypothetical protein n=1 Tax=Nostoc sp. 'Peltigera membranacea cyanobiont' N6 TaxID=1261031 RepID=UPI0015E46969|nr:hypothetical protein [Nostoc sp. 'Peltigera membranacea cyanobiont' N6]